MNKQPIYLETVSGNYINLNDIDSIRVEPVDISQGLANITRYNGRYPVSVLRHSYAMYQYAKQHYAIDDDEYLMHILLHDAAEAYIGDTPSPVKQLSNLGDLEDKLHEHILRHLMVETPEGGVESKLLSDLDRLAMVAELYIYKHNYDETTWLDTCKYYGIHKYFYGEDLESMVRIFENLVDEFSNDKHLAMHVENLIFRHMYKQGA